ncbi:hypothetical protein DFS34DRAFT_651700 [Phlyctochytrium arcticum]|nr:hypothetical protein DFS34DRAFT_651700 [Phlyctochytrium arcticum]
MSEPKDIKKKLPWGIEKTKPGSIKKISNIKLKTFSVGIQKKTPFQRQKEEAELKKKKEDEEAARVYAEFVADFEQDANPPKGWVKGGTMMPSAAFSRDDYDDEPSSKPLEKKSIYAPKAFVKAGESAKVFQESSAPAKLLEVQPTPSLPKAQRKRNLDAFLEELKKDQEERDQRLQKRTKNQSQFDEVLDVHADSTEVGSHDTGDPDTTNLYVGNISPLLDEQQLCREFAAFGPIASVKIMWPRSAEERDRNRNCGFVSFMRRDDAAAALRGMDGRNVEGHVLKVGWGKAVIIPKAPIFELPHKGDNKQSFTHEKSTRRYDQHKSDRKPDGSRMKVQVVIPQDTLLLGRIHKFTERSIIHGPAFELAITQREQNNPEFTFLTDTKSEEQIYYKWKLYSILQGESKHRWSMEPFLMCEGGALWYPPYVPFYDEVDNNDNAEDLDGSDSDPDSSKPRSRTGLTRRQRHDFELMLRMIDMERDAIAKIMVFAIDHAHAHEEIISIITSSLLIHETPIFPVKISRLYVVSDILHNSATPVPNAWKYRSGFEQRLEGIMAHFGEVCRSIPLRLRREQIKRAVMTVLGIWEGWIVFPQTFIDTLRQKFLEHPSDDAEITTSVQQDPSSITSTKSTDTSEESVRDDSSSSISLQPAPGNQPRGNWESGGFVDQGPAEVKAGIGAPSPDATAGWLQPTGYPEVDRDIQAFVQTLAGQGIEPLEQRLLGEELRTRLISALEDDKKKENEEKEMLGQPENAPSPISSEEVAADDPVDEFPQLVATRPSSADAHSRTRAKETPDQQPEEGDLEDMFA